MPPIAFYDAHNHFHGEGLRPYRASLVRDLESIGLARAVVNGTTEADWDDVAALAREQPWILPSYGLHPWYLRSRTTHWRERLEALIDRQPQCAIGEIGLDRWIPDFDPEEQTAVFLSQLALATERNRPVTIHCLKAWGTLCELLRREPTPRRGFLLHAYGGPMELVEEWVERGGYFSFSGSFLDPRKTSKREVFRRIPAERLLVETDAPSMPLSAEHRRWVLPDTPEGKAVNHPANLVAAYEGLAELRGWSVDKLASIVAENFARLFVIDPRRL